MRNTLSVSMLVALFCFSGFAQEYEEPESSSILDDVEVHGFVSSSYTYNINDPASNINSGRLFDPDHNAFNIDGAELVLLKNASESSRTGFRFDLIAGSTIPQRIHSSGLFAGQDLDLQQGFVTYLAPIGNGLTIDMGKFVSHVGAEVIEGFDNFNLNYSRGLVFTFAIPYTHTGLRARYDISENSSFMFMVANGWNNTDDTNEGKTFGLQYAVAPSDDVDLTFSYIGGPEQIDESGNYRHLLDVVGTLQATDRVSLTANLVYGFEKDAIGGTDNASWFGGALYSKISASDSFYLGLRGEYFKDLDGFRTGIEQALISFTATPSWVLSENLVVRSELRFDRSDEEVFEEDDGAGTKNQMTAALNAVVAF